MALTMRVPTGAPRLVFEDPGNPLTEGLATAASTLWNLGPRLRAIEEAKAERKRQQAMDTQRLGMQQEAHAAKMAQMQERPREETQPKPGKLHKITDPLSQATQWLRETPEGGLVEIKPQMLQPAPVAVEEEEAEAGPTRSWPQFWQDLGSGWLWDAQQIDPVSTPAVTQQAPTPGQPGNPLTTDAPMVVPSSQAPARTQEGTQQWNQPRAGDQLRHLLATIQTPAAQELMADPSLLTRVAALPPDDLAHVLQILQLDAPGVQADLVGALRQGSL